MERFNMRKLALTLLLAASLPAVAATKAETQASLKLTADIKTCAADAGCKEKALKEALDANVISDAAVLETALSNNVTVEVVLKAAVAAGKGSTSDAQAKAIEAVTKAVVKTDGSATSTSDSVAKVIAAAKTAKIPATIVNKTITNTKINGKTIPAKTIAAAKETAKEIVIAQKATPTLDPTAAGPEVTTPEVVPPAVVVPPVNSCGVSPNKPC